MIAGKQGLRHPATAPDPRPGVLRMIQKSRLKRLAGRGVRFLEHVRKQPRDGVYDHHGRQFSAGKNEIADGNFLVARPQHALIDALIMAADQGQSGQPGQPPGLARVESPSLRGKANHSAARPAHAADGGEKRFRLEHHAGAAAKGPVIHAAALVRRKISRIDIPQFQQAARARAAHDARAQDRLEHLRE